MFEFYGILSNKCLLKTSKRENISIFIIGLIITILGFAVSLTLLSLQLDDYKEFLAISTFLLILDILVLFCKPRSLTFKLPRKINIDIENNIITKEIVGYDKSKIKPKIRKVSSIKKIIDYGDWYCIVFFMDPSDTIACQKDLIKTGTLQEFEEIFKDKIVRKIKK